MAELRETLLIDLVQEQNYIYLKSKQYDNFTRIYTVHFFNRGIPYSLSGDELVIISIRKQGVSLPYVRKACVWNGNSLEITFTGGMLQYTGVMEYDFTIINGNTSITSRTSYIDVQENLIGYDGLMQSEEFSILNDLIQQAVQIPKLIDTFKISQNEINTLITKINSDISSYRSSYTSLSSQAQNLITQLENFLSTASAAEDKRVIEENERISEETVRQKNESDRIAAETARVNNHGAMVTEFNQVKTEVIEAGSYAETQANRVDAALINLNTNLTSIDCGFLNTTEEELSSTYDCGIL